jgi:lipopolysaccharide export system ATP-binding protein
MNRLTASHLSKSYAKRKVVVDSSFEICGGEVVGLLGPNGAGKTTSFYMVCGLVRADQGSILLNDQDITHVPMHRRAQLGIGYLPQEASIFRGLSVENNIMAILETRSALSATERKDKLETLLHEFHIAHIRNSLGQSLSGGERRRVEIARTLALDPSFILLDEPFAGVDPISVIDIKHIITELSARGIGVLITDHNIRETLQVCQRVYILAHGSILAHGDPQSIKSDPLVIQHYLGKDFH